MGEKTGNEKAGPGTAGGSVVARTLADYAYQRIRADIVSGTLSAGAKLRLEALSQQYEVGMSPLREALARLAGDALVVVEGQRGFWVAPLSLADFEDLSRVRGLIETEALQLSVERGGPDWEHELTRAFEELSRIDERLNREGGHLAPLWEDANRRFHEALVAACDSPWLKRMRALLYQQSERYRRISLSTKPAGRCVHEEHHAIYEAALRRQTLRACRLTEEHLQRTTDAVRAALRAAEAARDQR